MNPAPAPAAADGPRIDARLLYWTRLPPGAGDLGEDRLRYRFERVLPVPVDGLHVVSARLADGGTLLAGIEPARLRAHLAGRGDVTAATWSLVPDRAPPHLADAADPAALAALNLLHGPFEPAPRRRLRRLRDLAVGAALALALVLVLIGIERRADARAATAEATRRAGEELLARAFGPGAGPVPAPALLTQELRRLEQAARGTGAAPVDAAAVLQRLWSAWPADVAVQVETVSLAADRLVVRGAAPSLADAERLARACPTIAAGGATWQAAPLQAEQGAHGAAFLLTWQAPGPRGGAP